MGAFDRDDPFAAMLAPPKGETPAQKAEREKREAHAQKVSDRIDEELKQERAKWKKKTLVRVLLLGQSESGKSTTLKNFRMKYAKAAWKEERNSWRSVIQLNLLRSVLTILGALQAEMNHQHLTASANSAPSTSANPSSSSHHLSTPGTPYTSGSSSGGASPLSGSPRIPNSASGGQINLTDKHQLLKLRLTPLRRVEQDLKRRIGVATEEDDGSHPRAFSASGCLDGVDDACGGSSNSNPSSGGGGDDGLAGDDDLLDDLDWDDKPTIRRRKEFGVRDWKGVVEKQQSKECLNSAFTAAGFTRSAPRPLLGLPPSNGCIVSAAHELGGGDLVDGVVLGGGGGGGGGGEVTDDDATDVIASCKEDMKTLWNDPEVKAVLKKRKVKLQDSAGFFMDDLDRIATRNYEPSDDDIVRARLRTLAVQEHKILFDEPHQGKQFLTGMGLGTDFGKEWIIYDVGGSRTVRHAWLPYFDNVNAIIFLAPISSFDERLLEDPRINRLEDSFLLWKAVCSSKILSKSTIILFMNKCDILKRKLKAGVKVREYLPGFGERKNEVGVVVKYLREKFKDILRQHSPEPRVSYFYATSVTDTKATAATLVTVRDSILRAHLKSADFV